MGEALVRVMTGIFMFETFKAAAADDELMIMQKEAQQKMHASKMQHLFEEADEEGDGFLSYEEFLEIVEDVRVKTWLNAMDIDIADATVAFDLLDDGDQKLSAEELVHGF